MASKSGETILKFLAKLAKKVEFVTSPGLLVNGQIIKSTIIH